MCLRLRALGMDNTAAAKRVSTASRDLIESLLQDALENRYNVELSMKNGKVYIGRPRRSGVTTSSDSDRSLVPVMSGRRDAELRLEITTFYTAALREFAGEGSSRLRREDSDVVLPKEQILSARRFGTEVYVRAFSAGHGGRAATLDRTPGRGRDELHT